MPKSKQSSNNVTITVYFFKMDGCGHCEHLKPIWNSVVEEMNKSHPAIVFKEVESDDIPKLPDDIRRQIKAETIVGYPDLRLLTSDNKMTQFNDDRNKEAITRWIKATSGGSSTGMKGGRSRKRKHLRSTLYKSRRGRSSSRRRRNRRSSRRHNRNH